jgi:hypothetical protein
MVGNKINTEGLGIKMLYKSGYRSKAETNKDIKSIPLRRDVRFYIDNCERGGLGRIRQQLKEDVGAGGYTAYIYTPNADETVDNNRLLKILGDATLDAVTLTESLPKVQRKSSGGSVNYYDEEDGRILSKSMSVKFEDSVYIPTKKGECFINGRWISDSTIAKIIGYIYADIGTDKTFYFLTPSQIKTRKLDERGNWMSETHLVSLIRELGAYHAEETNAIRNQHTIGNGSRFKDVFKKTQTNNRAKEILEAYEEYHNAVNKSYDKLDDIWNLCHKIGLTVHEDDAADIDTKARFEKPLNKELKKYPLLHAGVLNHLWSDDQRQAVADYIDLVENSTKELTTV